MVQKQIPAARQRESRLAGLGAQEIGVEQGQVGRLTQMANALEHLALDQQAKAPEPFDLDPLALMVLAPLARKRIHRLDIDQPPPAPLSSDLCPLSSDLWLL